MTKRHPWQQRWLWLTMILIGLIGLVLVSHDQVLYRQPIGRVVSVRTTSMQKSTDEFHNVDYVGQQRLRVRVLNGDHRGKIVTVNNRYSRSGALDQRYRQGQEAFLIQLHHSKQGWVANINGLKRDTLIFLLAWLAASLLVLMLGSDGLRALISVLLNFGLLWLAIGLDLRWQASGVLAIFGILAILLAAVTVLLVFGPNWQSALIFAATVIATVVSMLICLLVMTLTSSRGIYYESMAYVTQNPRPLFLAEVMLGSLGAIMDEASDTVATMFELKRLKPDVGAGELWHAGLSVGRSVMGPLINVLLMIFFAGTFTAALLYLKNGNSWGYTFDMSMCLGMVQSLVAAIGIVVNVPLISAGTAMILGRRPGHEHD